MDDSTHTSPVARARTYSALRITVDGKLELIQISSQSGLTQLQAAVGGDIEILGLAPDLSMVLDEEGKLKDQPNNDIAIRLTQHYAVGLKPWDLIAGDVVLVGRAYGDDGAYETDVPDSVIQLLARLGYPLS